MNHYILLDELAIKEIVESNIYQSRQFEAGESLAHALGGNKDIHVISPKIIPTWRKDVLYILQSRGKTGYLTIDSSIFGKLPGGGSIERELDERLMVFQRICRFALKEWNGLSFSFSEMWSSTTRCAVVFPYPKSKHVGFRVSLKIPEADQRLVSRHGDHYLFAFSAGTEEEGDSTEEQRRKYKRAFEELGSIRTSLDTEISRIQKLPNDQGYFPLVLAERHTGSNNYQTYDQWLGRLTKSQKDFVTFESQLPQRVEGPAGTGKTLCLLLRSFFLCKIAEESTKEMRVIFISHSDATKNATINAFDSLGEPYYHLKDHQQDSQSVVICTLQEWCGKILGPREIANAQYLDQDALAAKEMRRLILKDIVESRRASDTKPIEYLSEDFRDFFLSENSEYLAELLQHEIGVMIKGRASENLDSYIGLPMLAYCLPSKNANDRRFVFSIYNEYQSQLNLSGVFDTDDIVLSTLGRLNTPIWRRRRTHEGFDAIVIDETHLFNFNELSLFHHLLRAPQTPHIIFSIDRSQAPGDRGMTTKLVREVLMHSQNEEVETKTQVVFRCAPAIVKLAEAVTAAGATLFTTFENPLIDSSSVIVASDEAVTEDCIYWDCSSDEKMCDIAIARATVLCAKFKCKKSDILLVAMTTELLQGMTKALKRAGHNLIELIHRGDLDAVKRGFKEGAFLLSHPDYVGGLEFKAVLIVGVDEGRVPPSDGVVKDESRHFIEFKACNRLYVAISRARLIAELFYSRERGRSRLLDHAVSSGAILIEVVN
jgi:hypothetical protein